MNNTENSTSKLEDLESVLGPLSLAAAKIDGSFHADIFDLDLDDEDQVDLLKPCDSKTQKLQ